ncbi:penicillin acylase family protein [Lysobacter enzymogenes]|uniref:penicillin acylase family protein n=1 Tax=Lysobacter enzymogenes TaxID=69 RepID=UPI0008975F86|nr:penicillin acylase family protein [Lysobacter enzymogenes]SDW73651.1 penicillin amidase [Lysobacter enzymogenes]
MIGFRKHPLLLRFALWICLPLAVAGWFGYSQLRASLPQTGGDVAVRGLKAKVSIARDDNGVPYVRAASDMDAYFALGYLHAQDRLWQLEVARRLAQGRLSEVLGRKALPEDVWMRTLDLYGSARSAWPALSEPARASLQAYADGINAYLGEKRTLPPEFLLLGVEPQPWHPIDSLAWFKVFSLNQSDSMRTEANRYVARKYLPASQWALLERDYPADAPVTVDALPAMQDIAQMGMRLEDELGLGGKYVGSNAWAVSGKHTADGSPLLANDPHMGLQMPSLWYVADLSAPGFHASGMSVVGLPNIVFGRNGRIAWGGTNMMADTQDLYVLDTDPERPNHYKADGQWQALDVRQEEIQVKNDFPAALRKALDPVRIQVRRSTLGPVISDALRSVDQPVALRWPGLDPGDTSYEGIFRLAYAGNWQEFNAALAVIVAPAINVVYADADNNIGYAGAGRIPRRGAGDGTLPVPAADPRYAWQGYVPFAEMPRVLNPASGFVVSANNKVAGENYPHFISRDWAPPARAERITAMIQGAIRGPGKIRVEDVEKMQGDVKDLEAGELKDYLLGLLPASAAASAPVRQLKAWDGSMARDQAAAAVFSLWLKNLKQRMLLDRFKDAGDNVVQLEVLRGYVAGVTPLQIKRMLMSGEREWCGGDAGAQRCAELADASLHDALKELDKWQGDESRWQWGELHQATFQHLPFSDVNLLDRVFGRRIPSPGSENSVDVAASRYKPMKGFEQTFGAVFRQVMSLAPGEGRHRYMNSTGQSGNPLSRHFDDMLEPFNRVEFFALRAPAATPAGAAGGDVLTLTPSAPVQGARQ